MLLIFDFYYDFLQKKKWLKFNSVELLTLKMQLIVKFTIFALETEASIQPVVLFNTEARARVAIYSYISTVSTLMWFHVGQFQQQPKYSWQSCELDLLVVCVPFYHWIESGRNMRAIHIHVCFRYVCVQYWQTDTHFHCVNNCATARNLKKHIYVS